MSQYCFEIINPLNVEVKEVDLKKFVDKLYHKKKFDGYFGSDEAEPFGIIFVRVENNVCIVMTSKAKKNIERIEKINSQFKSADLKYNKDISLKGPFLFDVDQTSWWSDTDLSTSKVKWETLTHNGPYFTHILEPYEPLGASLLYEEVEYPLSPEEERIAGFYAARIISENAGNVTEMWTRDKVFNKNFWTDFKKYLSKDHKKIIKNFKKIDFSDLVQKIEEKRERNKNITPAEKKNKKEKIEEKKRNYGYAVIDDKKEKLGNFVIEPAAIFYGRGKNPLRGKIKSDINPKNVIINVGKPSPKPPSGTKWEKVVHDHDGAWVARWMDPIMNKPKYVMFSAEGKLKGQSDLKKYEKARKLNRDIEKVRDAYDKDINSSNIVKEQLGTILFLVDYYGLRVGNEKGEHETDTVGASTLKVGNVKLESPDYVILDFLGKDSVRFYKKMKVPIPIYKNFSKFLENKNKNAQVFDKVNATSVNAYLKALDPEFTAKVFRTRLASNLMYEELNKIKIPKNATKTKIKSLFDKANGKVAELLNHQRTISKKMQESVKKEKEKLKNFKKEKKELQEEGKSLTAINKKIATKKDQIDAKTNTLNVAITTSRANYIDPRLITAWAKKQDIDLSPSIYSAALSKKFNWAISTTKKDWDYITSPFSDKTKLSPRKRVINKIVKSLTPTVKKLEGKCVDVVCPSDKICNPASGRCVKKTGAIGKTLISPKKSVKKIPIKRSKKSRKKVSIKRKIRKQSRKRSIKKIRKKSRKRSIKKIRKKISPKKSKIYLEDYSDKSFVVFGDTKKYKDDLRELGGKWNSNLRDGIKGWIFSKRRKNQVENYMKLL